ncbi:Exo5p Ecym_1188 [Eremothecium cymbalariae DBVPG|uniref:Exonuclease V, mitochondrial n=1 Tax=Eremothecium cymbalariae (strain CBS 270.75 / DBVPG 7215 / KCTC 17166 / NRRL Y-17582) TaxID=931890 RepID=G8JMX3_ERECY|nr:hypothetical protein Ecym_1188 [Eremothecium cymbalariae DBVPG\
MRNIRVTSKLSIRLFHGRKFANLVGDKDATLVTTAELNELKNHFKLKESDSNKATSSVDKLDEREYRRVKLDKIRQLFASDTVKGYLAYQKPKSLQNPYLDIRALPLTDSATGEVTYEGKARLSVTKLLTKRWCELKETYDIYSKMPIYRYKYIEDGNKQHQALDDDLHAPSKEALEFTETFELLVPTDSFHEYAGKLLNCINRICTLFQEGEAREILCHGYVDSNNGKLVYGAVRNDADVLISGIIDHLIFVTVVNKERHFKLPLSSALREDHNNDLRNILEYISQKVRDNEDRLEILVSDVKTRRSRRIPPQDSVRQASKLQVMYYRYFLESLGSDAEGAYINILTNAKRRGYDVDAPINPVKLICLMETESIIMQDMARLRDGKPIGFDPFDEYYMRKTGTQLYDLSSLANEITDVYTLQKYREYFIPWETPFTLRYLAARLAQAYGCISPLLSNTVMVEYSYNYETFHNAIFKYDFNLLQEQCTSSSLFWFGKRDIEPIEPTLRNFTTYCTYCDYKNICLWKKRGIENLKSLGKDLMKIHKPNIHP